MKKFIIMAVSLLLTALLALAGCMYAIGENKAESKPYDMGETVSVAPEDTPTAQEEMEQKFSVYNHVTEEDGKKILTLFSEEQAEEQWPKRGRVPSYLRRDFISHQRFSTALRDLR